MDRLQVALIALSVGWALSQLTEVIKSKCRINRLKLAISTELKDLEVLLSERMSTAKGASLKYGHDGYYVCSLGAPVSTPVLDAYYYEVAENFSEEQRYNIRVLRDHIRAYSTIVEWVENNTSGKATQNEIVFKLFEAYKQAAFASVFIKAANEVSGKEKIVDEHESLNELRKEFKVLTPQLALRKS